MFHLRILLTASIIVGLGKSNYILILLILANMAVPVVRLRWKHCKHWEKYRLLTDLMQKPFQRIPSPDNKTT